MRQANGHRTGHRRIGPRAEDGFGLVELMMVVLIIAILIALALPSFIGARKRATDRATAVDLRTGLAAALTYFAEAGSWTGFDAAEAELAEPVLAWQDGGPPPLGVISIHVHAGSQLLLVRQSSSGEHLCVAQVAGAPATSRGSGATFADVDTLAECTGGW